MYPSSDISACRRQDPRNDFIFYLFNVSLFNDSALDPFYIFDLSCELLIPFSRKKTFFPAHYAA